MDMESLIEHRPRLRRGARPRARTWRRIPRDRLGRQLLLLRARRSGARRHTAVRNDRDQGLPRRFDVAARRSAALEGEHPRRPEAVRGADGCRDPDFAEADVFLPHPVYGALGWVCVVNPGQRTEAEVLDLLRAAHGDARRRDERRSRTGRCRGLLTAHSEQIGQVTTPVGAPVPRRHPTAQALRRVAGSGVAARSARSTRR